MPAVKIFQQLRDRVMKSGGLLPEEKRAMFWFKNYADELDWWQAKYTKLTYDRLAKQTFTKQIVGPTMAYPGFFYFFMYDAKLKQTLPYWDKFPFVLVLHVQKDRFLGLNFHYLDYSHRARFFDALYRYREGRTPTKSEDRSMVRDIRMRMRVTYAILKYTTKYKAFKPCIKCYLKSHIKSPLMKVGAKEWDVALFLPVERFQKETKTAVWAESNRKIK